MARYHGSRGAVYASTSGTGTLAKIAALSKWSLDATRDRVDVTSFGDTNKRYVQGLPDIKGQVSGFWDDVDDSLFDASESTDGCKLLLYPSDLTPTHYWSGPAWLDASIDVDNGGAITVSGSFVANGNWARF